MDHEFANNLRAKVGNGREVDIDPIVELRCGSDVQMEPVEWLWEGWLPSGKLTILAGVPGLGKTTLALSIAAAITKGGLWPDGLRCKGAGNVLIWSGEDGIEDTLAPRLTGMGADVSRIHFVDSVIEYGKDYQRIVRDFDPAQDMPRLVAAAEKVGDVKLLIIDPVSMAVAGDSNKNAEVRRGLSPLAVFAEQLGAGVLGISHFSKGTAGKEPLDRVTGSLAFGAAPRMVLAAVRIKNQSEEGEQAEAVYVMVRTKSNLGPSGGGFEYQFDQIQLDGGITASRIVWGKSRDGSAIDIMATAEQTDDDYDASALDEAVQCLREILGDGGPHEAGAVSREARSAGHAERTIRRAREALRIKPERDGHTRKWYWRLTQGGQVSQPKNNGHLGHLGHLDAPTEGRAPQGGQGGQGFESGASGHLTDREAF